MPPEISAQEMTVDAPGEMPMVINGAMPLLMNEAE
jgi:hypothetical protein